MREGYVSTEIFAEFTFGDFALFRKDKLQNKRRKFVCPQKLILQSFKINLDSQNKFRKYL